MKAGSATSIMVIAIVASVALSMAFLDGL